MCSETTGNEESPVTLNYRFFGNVYCPSCRTNSLEITCREFELRLIDVSDDEEDRTIWSDIEVGKCIKCSFEMAFPIYSGITYRR